MMLSMLLSYTGILEYPEDAIRLPSSSGLDDTSIATMSILGRYTSDTWTSSNLMADLISSLSSLSMTPSLSISSIMTSSSSSVIVSLSGWFLLMNLVILENSQEIGERMISSARITPQILMQTFSGLLLAMDLGVISPKIRTATVMKTVDATAPVSAPRRRENTSVARDVPAMFTRLFPTRTVVRNL